jgi:hypothetical protein
MKPLPKPERWTQHNKPMVEDDKPIKLLHATVYKFNRDGKIVQVVKRGA